MKVFGLVLAGGESRRMQVDKGSIIYPQLSPLNQRERALELLRMVCSEAYVSLNSRQVQEERMTESGSGGNFSRIQNLPVILDSVAVVAGVESSGPAVGIVSAYLFRPNVAWLVLACDLPFVDRETLANLVEHGRSPTGTTTAAAYESADGSLEPLLSIWKPRALEKLFQELKVGNFSPKKVLEQIDCKRLRPSNPKALIGVNCPYEQFQQGLQAQSINTLE